MRKSGFCLLLTSCIFLLAAISCTKKSSGGSGNGETLVVETTPSANGHLEAPAPGPNFPVNVTIKSTMPASGVKIDINAKPAGGTTAFYTESRTTTTASNDFTVTGTTPGVSSVVTITVTSVTNSSNTWTGNYTYSRK